MKRVYLKTDDRANVPPEVKAVLEQWRQACRVLEEDLHRLRPDEVAGQTLVGVGKDGEAVIVYIGRLGKVTVPFVMETTFDALERLLRRDPGLQP